MRRTDFIEQLRRRLLDLGCPIMQVRQLVQEVADHREDLKQAALSEGLPESTAETRSEEQLGNPLDLAERLAMAVRQSSWWGRHFVLGFCLLPLVAVPVLWGLLVLLGLWLERAAFYGLDSKQLHIAADRPGSFHHIFLAVHCTDYIAIALVSLLFCWLARRAALSLKWTVTACSICSLYSLFSRVTIVPHSLVVGVSWAPQWIRFAIPLLISATVYALRRRTARCFGENVAV
jgi:hypothetical protein